MEGIARTPNGTRVFKEGLQLNKSPLIVKLNNHVSTEDYKERLERLKEQYNGDVVLLKMNEVVIPR